MTPGGRLIRGSLVEEFTAAELLPGDRPPVLKAYLERYGRMPTVRSGFRSLPDPADQSDGSTPKALALYGVPESDYPSEEEMFDLMHAFRSRIIAAPAFGGDRIFGAILFEQTMDRDVAGTPTPRYLWQHKQVVPFVEADEGLADEKDGVRPMKPFTRLDDLLARADPAGARAPV